MDVAGLNPAEGTFPNCDSQLDTYKSKNKNGARSYYRYHKYDEETKIGK